MTVRKHSVKQKAPVKQSRGVKKPHEVEIDEARSVVPPVKSLALGSGFDVHGTAEELGETFVENVTGADDAATEHRAVVTAAEKGGPFLVTSGATEFAAGTDASTPPDALREALPTVRRP